MFRSWDSPFNYGSSVTRPFSQSSHKDYVVAGALMKVRTNSNVRQCSLRLNEALVVFVRKESTSASETRK